jgi:hypothetical protein
MKVKPFFPNSFSIITVPFNKCKLSKLISEKRKIPAPDTVLYLGDLVTSTLYTSVSSSVRWG